MNIYAIGFPCSEGFRYVKVDFSNVGLYTKAEVTYCIHLNKTSFYDEEAEAFRVLNILKELDPEGDVEIIRGCDYYDDYADYHADHDITSLVPSVKDLSVIKLVAQKLDAPEF